jgi:hypothetical protein
MEIFLRAKHWQLFLLTFAIPFLLQIVMMVSIFSHLLQHPDNVPDVTEVFSYFKLFPFIMVLYMGTLFGWQFSVATGLQKMVPAGVNMNVKKFKIFFFIPIVYITLILIFVSFILTLNFTNVGPSNFSYRFVIPFLLIIPLHFFAMFCIFYCLYFVAKTFKTVELQRAVTFNDFVAEFFLIWFFPIGVWIIQPKINKMIKEYYSPVEDVAQE